MRSAYNLLATCYGSRRDYNRLLKKLQRMTPEEIEQLLLDKHLDEQQRVLLKVLLDVVYLG